MNARQLIILLQIKLRITFNGLFRGSGKKRTRSWLALLGGGVFFFFIFKWAYQILTSLLMVTSSGSGLIENFITLSLFGFFIFLVVGGSTVTIHYLFITTDLPLLMSFPMSSRTIFAAKLIEAMVANSSLFLFMGIPICLAYGVISSAQWFYYPMMLIVAVLFLAVPISLAFLLALLITKVIPPSRARDILAVLFAVMSVIIWVALQLVRASSFDRNSPDFSPSALATLESPSHSGALNLLPSTWMAQSLFGLAHADFQLFFTNLLILSILVASLFLLSIRLSQYAFREGYLSGASVMRLKKTTRAKPASMASPPRSRLWLAGVTSSVFIRDLRLLMRNTRQLVSIAMLGVMMIIITFMQQRSETDPEIAAYSTYIFILLFSGILAGQISSRLIPIEGKSFWITKLAPQPISRILLGKFFLSWLLSVAITWVAVIFHAVYAHLSYTLVVFGLFITACMTAALCSAGLFISSHFARFDWDHPKRMLSGAGGPILVVTAIVLTGIVMAIYGFGTELGLSPDFLHVMVAAVMLLCTLIIGVIAGLGTVQKLQKMEWEY